MGTWVDHEDFRGTWQVWAPDPQHPAEWPTDKDVPDNCSCGGQLVRRVVRYEERDGTAKKAWRYDYHHRSHRRTA